MNWRTILFTIIAVLLVIFTIQNHIQVSLRFLSWELNEVPLVFVFLGALIFGFFMAQILQMPRIFRLKRELKKALRDLENARNKASEPNEKINSEGVSMGDDYEGGFFADKE